MERQVSVRQPGINDLLAQGIAAARAGYRKRAHQLLTQLVNQHPEHERAWLWLSFVAPNPRQARAYLRQVLRINPRNRRAVGTLRQIDARLQQGHVYPEKSDASPRLPDTSARQAGAYTTAPFPLSKDSMRVLRRWAGIWLLVAASIVILGGFVTQAWVVRRGGASAFIQGPMLTPSPSATVPPTLTPTPGIPQRVAEHVPELKQAWENRNWGAAVALLDQIARLDHTYPGLETAKCDTYLNWARDQANRGQIEQAYLLYRRARTWCEGSTTVQMENSLALRYLTGKWRHDHGQWREAAILLQAVYDLDPDFAETHSLLYTSYLSWSQAALADNDLDQARGACEAAIQLEPESDEAQTLLKEIQVMLTPTPTPTPANPLKKRIEIDISKQRMYVWQGDTMVYNWVCSTGRAGNNTAPGRFRVQSKIPEAWASTWSLRMPYWLGIYHVGRMENGIHALPINANGVMLWAGYLGTPASFGCIILSTENARTLYNWANIGTPVWIHY